MFKDKSAALEAFGASRWTPEDQRLFEQLQARRREAVIPIVQFLRKHRVCPDTSAPGGVHTVATALARNAAELMPLLRPFMPTDNDKHNWPQKAAHGG